MSGLRLFAHFVKLFIGTTVLAWTVCVPVIGAALVVSPRVALILLIVLAILAFTLLLVLPEWGVLRVLQGQLPRTYGLRNSYELASADSGVKLKTRPALVTFPDPVPNVFVIRALGGDGMILLSDGFISVLDETELRFVLKRAIQHLRSPEVVLQSACIHALMIIRRNMTLRADHLAPRGALKDLVLFPWLRFFSGLALSAARNAVTRRVAHQDRDVVTNEDFIRGASKLSRAEHLYGQQAVLPGLVYLGIER